MSAALKRLHQRHRELARQLADIGPVLKGSVVQRYMPCGNPNCRCQGDPPQLHGPYWQWSTAINGKTLTRRLKPDQVPLYMEWTDNRKKLDAVLAEIYRLTRETSLLLNSKPDTTASDN